MRHSGPEPSAPSARATSSSPIRSYSILTGKSCSGFSNTARPGPASVMRNGTAAWPDGVGVRTTIPAESASMCVISCPTVAPSLRYRVVPSTRLALGVV